MSYDVLLQPRAAHDLEAAYRRAAEHAPETSRRWYNKFLESLATLSENPQRCAVAPESSDLPAETRQFLHRTAGRSMYRVLFTIGGREVRIVCIRSPGQDLVRPEEL